MSYTHQLKRVTELAQARRYQECLEICRGAVDEHPDNAEAFDALGYVHMRMGAHSQALDAISSAVELVPREPAYRFHRVRALVQLERYSDAVRDAREIVRLCHELDTEYHLQSALFYGAWCLWASGRFPEAREMLADIDDDYRTYFSGARRTKAELTKALAVTNRRSKPGQ